MWTDSSRACGARVPCSRLGMDLGSWETFFWHCVVMDGCSATPGEETWQELDLADIQAVSNGEEDAYKRMVERYQPLVSRQMWRFTRDPVLLEELVQEVFVQAYFSLTSYRAEAPFLHWIRRVATRVGYQHWKRQERERRRREALQDSPIPTGGGSSRWTALEAADAVHRLLARMKPRDRLVLTLLHLEGCDTREISERTGWSRSLVKVRAHRARKKLKALLVECGLGKDDHV